MSQSALPPLLQRAISASNENDSETALNLLFQARSEEPESAWACFLLGGHLAQAKRYTEAEEQYINAVLLDPEMVIARYELGTLQFTSGRAPAAMLSWQPLLTLPDDHYLKQFVLGYAALAVDNFAEALMRFERGIAANSDNEPLNGNIRLLTERIRLLSDGTEQAPRDLPNRPVAEGATEHFLLSSYGKNVH
ncbi:tetratricopeptide repeat protein [Herbaspirillum sp. WGmk3]|uniref:tetratricopeptide repeat protein n=1 Tax=Herbaspirillum sp. WGmk3 TaxID=2919925 RepID=UPI0020919830|nr:tetratricopeptide repeat protein [Herbaspirillum sp. WGmk3]MCO4855918.1 tetratricopeptide repeat protein [Herbaspirillum sp. WGmk3]